MTPPKARPRRSRPSRRGPECGAASLDYLGALLAASLVIAAVGAGLLGPQVPALVQIALCRILTVGGTSCGGYPTAEPTRNDEDFTPSSCRVREQSEKGGATVSIGWFSIGKESGFIRQEFSDGSVRLTLVDSASIGAAAAGQDKLFDIGKLSDDAKAGARVTLAGGLTFGYGTTWQFGDAAEEKKFRGEIDKYAMQQQQLESSGDAGAGIAIYNSITGNWADPPDPTISFATTSVDASLKGALGLKIPAGPAPVPGAPAPMADPGIGGSLTLTGEYKVLLEHNQKTGITSWTYQLTGTAAGSVHAVAVGGEATGATSGAFRVARNRQGELVSVSFVSTREGAVSAAAGITSPVPVGSAKAKGDGHDSTGAGQVTVTTTTLDLTNDRDRTIAQQWLSASNEQFGSPLNLTYSIMEPARPAAPGDAFGQLMYEQATMSQTRYRTSTSVQSFGAEVNLGFKLGFSADLERSSSTAVDSTYLGAPNAGGTRPKIDFTECR